MSRALTDALLVVSVIAVWLGCLGFARVSTPYDRLHCVTFVSVAAGVPLMLACWLNQGASEPILKIVFLVLFALLNGATLAHATGRAVLHRERSRQDTNQQEGGP